MTTKLYYNDNGTPTEIPTGTGLPSQSGHSGKVLTTDGSSASWSDGFLAKSGGTMTGDLIAKNGYKVQGVPDTAEAHNCIYRGKEHTVESLSEMTTAANFSDIFIGDYFKASISSSYGTYSNVKFLVAGINYFENCGDTQQYTPHLVIVPEVGLAWTKMNSTATTSGGYVGSAMHTTVLPALATALKTAIGSSHVLAQRRDLVTTVNASTPSMAGAGLTGASTGHAWTDCELCLLNSCMCFGHSGISSSHLDIGDRKSQLPLFSLVPQMAYSNRALQYWLSDVVSSTAFGCISNLNNLVGADADNGYCIARPFFVFR